MNTFKLAVLTTAVAFSGTAMANVVTNAGHTIVDSGKTVFTTLATPGAINAEIGTLGYGASIAWSANESTEVVAGWNGGSFNVENNIGGSDSIINWKKVLGNDWENYQGKLKLDGDYSNPYLGVNLRPWKNRLTVGTGVIVQDNKLNATLISQEGRATIKIDNKEYQVNGDINVKAKSGNTLAPYLTLGVKPNINSNSRLGFFGEVGAAYTGKWKTEVNVDNATVLGGQSDVQFKADLEKTIRDNNPTWYPIVKVGATYRF